MVSVNRLIKTFNLSIVPLAADLLFTTCVQNQTLIRREYHAVVQQSVLPVQRPACVLPFLELQSKQKSRILTHLLSLFGSSFLINNQIFLGFPPRSWYQKSRRHHFVPPEWHGQVVQKVPKSTRQSEKKPEHGVHAVHFDRQHDVERVQVGDSCGLETLDPKIFSLNGSKGKRFICGVSLQMFAVFSFLLFEMEFAWLPLLQA